MAIGAYFHPNGMTLAQFEETHRRLQEAGAAEPSGRLHHSRFGEDADPPAFADGDPLARRLTRAWSGTTVDG